MGLDMYLYTKEDFEKPSAKESCYWRKVNWLHRYFTEVATNADEVENDNLTPFFIRREDLKLLITHCAEILSSCVFPIEGEPTWQDEAETWLPTQSGFFFGDTAYNEWYLNGLVHTMDKVAQVLADYPDEEFVYMAWY